MTGRRRPGVTAIGGQRTPAPTAVEVAEAFCPQRLVQARQLTGKRRGDLAKEIGVPAWKVLHWEASISKPKAYEVEKIAEATGQTVPFFKTGRPILVLDTSDVFMCKVDR